MPTRMSIEAREAPEAVAHQIAANHSIAERIGAKLRVLDPPFIIIGARGSSDCAATYGKYLIETQTGVPVVSMAASVSSIYGAKLRLKGSAFVAISQSGRSPDGIAAAEMAKQAGAMVIALVNDETSPLANLADELLPLRAGTEQSVAATKSFITSLSALAQLVACWRGDDKALSDLQRAPAQLREAADSNWRAALPILQNAASVLVLGRGLSFGAAQETALKIKETCALHAEAFSAAEVRHGPMALVRDGRVVLALRSSDAASAGVDETLAGFPNGSFIAAGVDQTLPLPRAPAQIEPLLFVQAAYTLINELALLRGENPDAPPTLRKVTQTT